MKTAATIITLVLIAGLVLTGCQNVYVTSAKVYLQQNNLDKAKEQLLLGLDQNPKDAQAHYLLGDIYAQQKNYPEMLKEFDASLALSPKYKPDIESTKNKLTRDMYNNAADLFNKHEYDKTAEALITALTIAPQDRKSWSLLAKSYINAKKYTDAIGALNKVVELDPKYEAMDDRLLLIKMHYAVAQQETKDGNKDASLKSYEKAATVAEDYMSHNPTNKESITDAVSTMADSYNELARNEADPAKKEALENKTLNTFDQLLATNPNDPDLHFNKAVIYQTMNKFDEAQTEYQKAFELNPKDKDALLRATNLYIVKSEKDTVNAMDYYTKSIDGFKKYVELDPNNANVWQALGQVQIQVGSIKDAQATTLEDLKKPTAEQKKEAKELKAEAKTYLDDGKASLQKATDLKTQQK